MIRKTKFTLKKASRAKRKEIFEALLRTALEVPKTPPGQSACKLLVDMMELDKDIDTSTPILDIKFIEIFGDEDGNIKTLQPTTEINAGTENANAKPICN